MFSKKVDGLLFFEDDLKERREKVAKHKSLESTIFKINELTNFMWELSDLISWNGHLIILSCNEKVFIMQIELLDSVVKTLSSIKMLFEYGHISDVNVLIRKVRDDLFLYLYFLEVANRQSIDKPSKQEQNVIKWMEDRLGNLFITDILMYLMSNNQIKTAITKYQLRESWDDIGRNLNRFVHGNGRTFTELNYRPFDEKSIEKLSKDILFKLDYISSVFMVLLILIKPPLISSNDYVEP